MKSYSQKAGWRYVACCIALVCLSLVLFARPITAFASGSTTVKEKTREINIVYDDSGSMTNSTAWSEAKYAVEVFAAMMGENDVVNIYPMSSYQNPITLQGNGNAQNNVAIINQMSDIAGTPFAAVQTAGDELMTSEADEKWLVIFTDGYFEENNSGSVDTAQGILSYVGQNNAKVVYVAIGADAVDLSGYERELFYPYVTQNGSILDTMTEIASRVFNYQEVALSGVGTGTVTLDADIPLSKMIVFAQGEDVSVGEVQVNGAALQNASEKTVTVRVDQSSGGVIGSVFASGLNGVVDTVAAQDVELPFSDGSYTFACNTSNVKVYVDPGVSVEAVLTNNYGEAVSIGADASGTISEGDWKVSAKIVNPLTGAEIDPSTSSILSGAITDVVVTYEDGTVKEFTDGDTIPVYGSKIELYGRTSYQGISGVIEKTSQIYTFEVEESPLTFTFSQPGGYELDAVMLSTDNDLTFTVTIGSKALTAEEASKLKIKVDDTQGIEWTVEAVNDTGTFRLVPGYSSRKGLKAVTAGEVAVELSASLKSDGEKRSGTGSVKVDILTESKTQLQLTLTMPTEQIFSDGDTTAYMFDAKLRGVPEGDEERPYILVSVQVQGEDGTTRLLTDEEWTDGANGFSFRAEPVNQSRLWRFVQKLTLGGQSLDFDVVQGTEPSTYKLYLAGLSELNVLPNTSSLEVTLSLSYDNGGTLQGSDNGTVTVKPLAWWHYILYFLVVTGVVALIVFVLFMELKKPRIPRDFRPRIQVRHTMAGTPVDGVNHHRAKFKRRHTWHLWKPEECRITFDDAMPDNPNRFPVIFFTVVATGNGRFRITEGRLNAFDEVQDTVKFNGRTYAAVQRAHGIELVQRDTIRYTKQPTNFDVYMMKLTF